MTPPPDSQALIRGPRWQLVVTPEQDLEFFRDSGLVLGTRGYTRPVTLNEAASFLVSDDGHNATLVAGPVDDQAVRVTIETPSGATVDAELVSAHDLKWFWAQLPSRAAISAIEARNAEGAIVDEYTLPTMPPPDSGVPRPRSG